MNDYNQACAKAQKASEVFDAIRQSYRAGQTSDVAFLAAQIEHKAALAEYDVAYAAAAAGKPPETPTDPHQTLLLVAKRARAELSAIHDYVYRGCDGGCPADDILRFLAAAIADVEAMNAREA